MSILRQFKTPKPVYFVVIALIIVIVFSIIFYGKHEIESSPYFSLIIQHMNRDEEILLKYGAIESYELVSFKGKNDNNGILVNAEYILLVKGEKHTGKLKYLIENRSGEIEISYVILQ